MVAVAFFAAVSVGADRMGKRAMAWIGRLVIGFTLLGLVAWPGAMAAERAGERARMVETIRAIAKMTAVAGETGIDPTVLDAMRRVLRHELVPDEVRPMAYQDRPLPIGYGQTISQPYIVALMTDLLDVGPDAMVLEVGTGSGYQAAVLAELVQTVHSIEIVPGLAERATGDLARLGYANVRTRAGDGYFGWSQAAPFDGIVVTAAASHVPPPLVEQLRPGARMVIPVGAPFTVQYLVLVEKALDGSVGTQRLLPVRFVPLTGGR